MKAKIRDAAFGAFLGSLAVVGAFGLLVVMGVENAAPWVLMWQKLFGGEAWLLPAILGGLAFVAIGTLWGLPFAFFEEPSTFKGIVYGIVPTIWAWTGVPLILGRPPLGGLDPIAVSIPVVMNCLIWGSILGWWCQRKVFGEGGASVYY